MNYTSREVVRRLKQYDMFLNTLNLSTDDLQRERICDQLDKIEKQILLETNTEYENQYLTLFGEETSFFEDEKERLNNLITLVNERKEYLENRKNEHKKVTGSLVELTTFLGEDKLEIFKDKLAIIDKYEANKIKKEKLIKELKIIDVKLSESSRTVKANTRLNESLEKKMKILVKGAIDKFNLHILTKKKNEILDKFTSLEYVHNLANENLKIAEGLDNDIYLPECKEQAKEINKEYNLYNQELNIIRLIDIYDNKVNSYEEILRKREEISIIMNNIEETDLFYEINDEINKQYNTIKLEKKDIENYEGLKLLREEKNNALYDIDKENNSKEFKETIGEIVKNENRAREESIRRARQEEYDKRQKKLLEEQKLEASRLKRQKLVEESKLKEQQERVKKMKELQEKTVINEKNHKKTLDNKQPSNLDSIFDTDELFENTRIVPNKKQNLDDSLFGNIEYNNSQNFIDESLTKPIKRKTKLIEEIENRDDNYIQSNIENEKLEKDNTSIPDNNLVINSRKDELYDKVDEKVSNVDIKNNSSDNIEDLNLFSLNQNENKNEINDLEVESNAKGSSIYDILENSDNIIWKPTDTKVNLNTIPVIENNNFNPKVVETKVVNSGVSSTIKGGDVLWKETQ